MTGYTRSGTLRCEHLQTGEAITLSLRDDLGGNGLELGLADPREHQCLDLRSADLRGTKFTHCDLSGSDFSGADLRGCEFEQCGLQGCRFIGSDLRGASLFWCEMTEASFVTADLRGALFEDCNAHSVEFQCADLRDSKFHEINCCRTWFAGAQTEGWDPSGTNLAGTSGLRLAF